MYTIEPLGQHNVLFLTFPFHLSMGRNFSTKWFSRFWYVASWAKLGWAE